MGGGGSGGAAPWDVSEPGTPQSMGSVDSEAVLVQGAMRMAAMAEALERAEEERAAMEVALEAARAEVDGTRGEYREALGRWEVERDALGRAVEEAKAEGGGMRSDEAGRLRGEVRRLEEAVARAAEEVAEARGAAAEAEEARRILTARVKALEVEVESGGKAGSGASQLLSLERELARERGRAERAEDAIAGAREVEKATRDRAERLAAKVEALEEESVLRGGELSELKRVFREEVEAEARAAAEGAEAEVAAARRDRAAGLERAEARVAKAVAERDEAMADRDRARREAMVRVAAVEDERDRARQDALALREQAKNVESGQSNAQKEEEKKKAVAEAVAKVISETQEEGNLLRSQLALAKAQAEAEVQQLKERLHLAEGALDESRRAAGLAKDAAAAAERASQADVQAAQEQARALERDLKEVRDECRALAEETNALRNAASSAQDAEAARAALKVAQEECLALAEEVNILREASSSQQDALAAEAALKAAQEECRAQKEKTEVLSSKNEALQADVDALREQVASLHSDGIEQGEDRESLLAQVARAEAEISGLKESLSAAEQRLLEVAPRNVEGVVNTVVEVLKGERDRAEDEWGKAVDMLEALEQAKESDAQHFESEVRRFDEEMKVMVEQMNLAKDVIVSTEEQLRGEQEAYSVVAEACEELRLREKEHLLRIETMEQELKSKASGLADVEETESRWVAAEAERDLLRVKLEDTKEAWFSAKRQYETVRDELHGITEQHSRDKEDLQKRLDESTSMVAEQVTEISSLKHQIRGLEAAAAEAASAAENSLPTLEGATREEELFAVTEKLARMEAESRRLREAQEAQLGNLAHVVGLLWKDKSIKDEDLRTLPHAMSPSSRHAVLSDPAVKEHGAGVQELGVEVSRMVAEAEQRLSEAEAKEREVRRRSAEAGGVGLGQLTNSGKNTPALRPERKASEEFSPEGFDMPDEGSVEGADFSQSPETYADPAELSRNVSFASLIMEDPGHESALQSPRELKPSRLSPRALSTEVGAKGAFMDDMGWKDLEPNSSPPTSPNVQKDARPGADAAEVVTAPLGFDPHSPAKRRTPRLSTTEEFDNTITPMQVKSGTSPAMASRASIGTPKLAHGFHPSPPEHGNGISYFVGSPVKFNSAGLISAYEVDVERTPPRPGSVAKARPQRAAVYVLISWRDGTPEAKERGCIKGLMSLRATLPGVLSAAGQPEEGPEVDKLLAEVRNNSNGHYRNFDPDCIVRFMLQPGREPRDLEGLPAFVDAMQACEEFLEDRIVVRVRPRGISESSPVLPNPASDRRRGATVGSNRRANELGLLGGPLGALRTARALVLGASSGIVGALFLKPRRTPAKARRTPKRK